MARRVRLRSPARVRFCRRAGPTGLPAHAIPTALLFFNLGVEIGQLAFVTAVLLTGEVFRRATTLRLEPVLLRTLRTGSMSRRPARSAHSRRSADREDLRLVRVALNKGLLRLSGTL